MKRIEVDFNVGQDLAGYMRLTCRSAERDLAATKAKPGEFVLLQQDHDVGVIAMLVQRYSVMYAKFNWNDIQDLESLLLGREVTRYHYRVSSQAVRDLSSDNRVGIEQSTQCGCFCCRQIFPAKDIKEWIDQNHKDVGQTALCPLCGIDSVLPDAYIELTPETLADMETFWFGVA